MTEYTTRYVASLGIDCPEDAVRQSVLKWEWLIDGVGHKRMRTLVDAGQFTLGAAGCPMCCYWQLVKCITMCTECPGYGMCLEAYAEAKAYFNTWRKAKHDRAGLWEDFRVAGRDVLAKLNEIQEDL